MSAITAFHGCTAPDLAQAHAPELFACGIAKSGAYNRTLTPFGFQAEERTLWQATDVYMQMSPFLNVRLTPSVYCCLLSGEAVAMGFFYHATMAC